MEEYSEYFLDKGSGKAFYDYWINTLTHLESEYKEEEGKSWPDIDSIITGLTVGEYINAIKDSGVWGARGFKQEDLDAILMLNLDPLIMKLFLTFSLGEKGQERILNYVRNGENARYKP